jgi:hypothetical protein
LTLDTGHIERSNARRSATSKVSEGQKILSKEIRAFDETARDDLPILLAPCTVRLLRGIRAIKESPNQKRDSLVEYRSVT